MEGRMNRRAADELRVRVLTGRERATLRAVSSYPIAVVAVRVVGVGLLGAGSFAVVANLAAPPLPVITVVTATLALAVSIAAFVAAANLTRLGILRFNLRGRQLIDPMGKRQFYAMFFADVLRGSTRSVNKA
jgi:hypothetical protein